MYPILWLPLTGNLDNHGLSTINVVNSAATFSTGILGNNLVMTKTTSIGIDMTDDCNESAGGFGVSMFCKIDQTITSGILFELVCNDITVILKFSGNKLLILESESIVCTSSIRISDFKNWGHIAMIYDGSNYHLYLNGKENIVSRGNIIVPIFVEYCRIGNGGDSIIGTIFSLKVYAGVPSVRNIIRDYQCVIMSYKFDGSGMGSDRYVIEYDASGFINNAELVSTEMPLVLSGIESPSRQNSVKIPSGNAVKIPVRPSVFFINFWIYVEEGSSSGVILSDSGEINTSLKVLLSSLDNGNLELSFSIGTDIHTKEILPVTWYMISLGYDGTNMLDIYVDAVLEESLSCGFSESGGIYPYIYDGDFQLGEFPGFISDYRQTLYKLSQFDLNLLRTRSVVIDNKGTVYGNDLSEASDKSFGFDEKGRVVSSSIEVKKSSTDNVDAINYNYTDSKLTLYDYEEN